MLPWVLTAPPFSLHSAPRRSAIDLISLPPAAGGADLAGEVRNYFSFMNIYFILGIFPRFDPPPVSPNHHNNTGSEGRHSFCGAGEFIRAFSSLIETKLPMLVCWQQGGGKVQIRQAAGEVSNYLSSQFTNTYFILWQLISIYPRLCLTHPNSSRRDQPCPNRRIILSALQRRLTSCQR